MSTAIANLINGQLVPAIGGGTLPEVTIANRSEGVQ